MRFSRSTDITGVNTIRLLTKRVGLHRLVRSEKILPRSVKIIESKQSQLDEVQLQLRKRIFNV